MQLKVKIWRVHKSKNGKIENKTSCLEKEAQFMETKSKSIGLLANTPTYFLFGMLSDWQLLV